MPISPIGSTARSPLYSWLSQDAHAPGNYGVARPSYEAGGALRLHTPGVGSLPGENVLGRFKDLYGRNSLPGVKKPAFEKRYSGLPDQYASSSYENPLLEQAYTGLMTKVRL